jgi:hypothetical protein
MQKMLLKVDQKHEYKVLYKIAMFDKWLLLVLKRFIYLKYKEAFFS